MSLPYGLMKVCAQAVSFNPISGELRNKSIINYFFTISCFVDLHQLLSNVEMNLQLKIPKLVTLYRAVTRRAEQSKMICVNVTGR